MAQRIAATAGIVLASVAIAAAAAGHAKRMSRVVGLLTLAGGKFGRAEAIGGSFTLVTKVTDTASSGNEPCPIFRTGRTLRIPANTFSSVTALTLEARETRYARINCFGH